MDDVAIIQITLKRPIPPWSIDLGSLIPISATRIIIVAKTARWAISLLPSLILFVQPSSEPPIKTGIKAVVEELSL